MGEEERGFMLATEHGWAVTTDFQMLEEVEGMGLEASWKNRVDNFIALAEMGEFIKVPNGRIIRVSLREWKGVQEEAA